MLKTAPSKPDPALVARPEPFTVRFMAPWNFPALDHFPVRALLALLILGACFIRAYVGMWGSRIYTQDAFSILDGAWRMINGQRPHVDFYTGLGPMTYLMTVVGVVIAGGNAVGLAYGQAIFGGLAGLWSYVLCKRRLRDLPTMLVCIIVVLMAIVPTTIGGSPTATTPATTYNRFGYALVALLMIEATAACRPNRRRDEFWGGASTGLVLGILLFLKVSFVMGGGFLVLALAPLRKQTRERWTGMGTGFALVFLAFAWYLRFDLMSMYNDLRTVAHSKHVMVGGYLLRDVIVNAGPFLLFANMISQTAGTRWDRRAIQIAGVGLCVTGFFLLMTSWQFYGLPLNSIMAILLLDRVLPASANVMPSLRLRPSVLLLGSFIALIYLGSEIVGLNYPLTKMLAQAPHTSFTAPALAGFNTTFERDYVEYINEGCDLLSQHRRPQDSVFSLNFSNPFSFALGMKPAAGGTTWLQYHTNFDEEGPSPERVFGEASVVMLPKVFSDGTLPDTVPRLYEPYLKSHYAVAAESLNWWLYRRKDEEKSGLPQELSKASVSPSR
jgi:hypothetical protein